MKNSQFCGCIIAIKPTHPPSNEDETVEQFSVAVAFLRKLKMQWLANTLSYGGFLTSIRFFKQFLVHVQFICCLIKSSFTFPFYRTWASELCAFPILYLRGHSDKPSCISHNNPIFLNQLKFFHYILNKCSFLQRCQLCFSAKCVAVNN